MQKSFKVKLSNHLSLAWTVFVYAQVYTLIPAYFYYSYGQESVELAVKLAHFFFLIVFIPHIIIHVQYWYYSSGVKFCWDNIKDECEYSSKGMSISFKLSQVVCVDEYKSKSQMHSYTMRFYPWDSYCYSILTLDSGHKILLTCLLFDEMVLPFNVDRKKDHGEVFNLIDFDNPKGLA